MKTTIGIPKTDVLINCRNKREINMVEHLLIHIDTAARIFADDGDIDALFRRANRIEGEIEAMLWLGIISMDEATTAITSMSQICMDMAKDGTRAYFL